MAKLTKEEFNTKYSEKITDNDDLVIELMEDFSDSISEDEKAELDSLKEEIEKKDAEIVELKRKYKERFLDSAKTEEKEFNSTYKMEVVQIPTNKPVIRKDLEDKLKSFNFTFGSAVPHVPILIILSLQKI